MFLLDTDHLVIAQRNTGPEAGRLRQRMTLRNQNDFFLSVISVHEQMLGASSFISQAKSQAQVVRGVLAVDPGVQLGSPASAG